MKAAPTDRNLTPASRKLVLASRCAWSIYNFRRNVIRAFEATGGEVVCVGGPLRGFEHRLLAEGYRFQPLRVPESGVSLLGDVRLFFDFLAVMRRERPDVVHCFTIKPAIYGTLAAALAGVPRRVCTITGAGHAFTEGAAWLRVAVEMLYRLALRRAHLVMFQNSDDRDMFVARRLVRPERTALIAGSGVDVTHFQARPHAPGLGTRPVRFLVVSRLLKEKGIREYIGAVERLNAAGVAAEHTLVGGLDRGNPTMLDAADVTRLVAAGVDWRGNVDDVRPHLEAADVVVLPSYREGAPRSLLEAMAVGRPIVTTDAIGCRSVVRHGENGFMVPVKDTAALAEALRRCVDEAARLPQMGAVARRFVEDNFDEAAVIAQTLAAYRL